MKIRKELKAGIITVVTILAFWWLFLFLKGRNLFSNQDVYYTKFENVAGLAKSKNVNINGLKVGAIESIKAVPTKDKNLTFIVELKIDKQYQFSKNSVAQVVSSFMGGSEIYLALANDGDMAKPGDTLNSAVIPNFMDSAGKSLKPLSENANTVLVKLDSTLAATNKLLNDENRANITQALVSLNQTINEFRILGKNANGLISDNTQKLSVTLDNTNKMMVTANNTVEKYGVLADKLNQTNFEHTIKSLETTLANLNDITGKINTGQGTMGKLVNDPAMYNNLNEATKNLSLLLGDVKANPKNYVHFSIFGGGKKKEKTKATQTTQE